MPKLLSEMFDPEKAKLIANAGMEIVEKTLNEFNEHIKQMTETFQQTTLRVYEENHKCCPKCRSEKYTSQLAGYWHDPNDTSIIKNMNRAWCNDCHHEHIVHDRIPTSR